MPTTAKQIFEYLPGIWRLSRQTLTSLKEWERSGAECIRGNGFAAFIHAENDPNVLIYSEKVAITVPDDQSSAMNGMEAKQKYKYRYDGQASTLSKYFFDDRLFYAMDASKGAETTSTGVSGYGEITACGEHLCERDFYEAKYNFRDQHMFSLTYMVNGPKKCYEICTEYERCQADATEELGIVIRDGEIV